MPRCRRAHMYGAPFSVHAGNSLTPQENYSPFPYQERFGDISGHAGAIPFHYYTSWIVIYIVANLRQKPVNSLLSCIGYTAHAANMSSRWLPDLVHLQGHEHCDVYSAYTFKGSSIKHTIAFQQSHTHHDTYNELIDTIYRVKIRMSPRSDEHQRVGNLPVSVSASMNIGYRSCPSE
jgi:hypothetical protein